MLPLMLHLYVSRLGAAGAPLGRRIESEIANHLGYIDGSLRGKRGCSATIFPAPTSS